MPFLVLILAMGLFNYGIIYFFERMGGDAISAENGLFRKGTIRRKTTAGLKGPNRKETINKKKKLELSLAVERSSEIQRL